MYSPTMRTMSACCFTSWAKSDATGLFPTYSRLFARQGKSVSCVQGREEVRRLLALFSQRPQVQGIMPFRQPLAVLIQHQIAVVPGRGGEPERTGQQNLPGSRLQEVGAPDHLCDLHRRVIDHNRKLIGGKIITPPHKKIAKVLTANKSLGTEVRVLELDQLALGNAKTPVCAGRLPRCDSLSGSWTAGSGIESFIVVRGLHGRGKVFARAVARVEMSSVQQTAPGVEVKAVSLALGVWSKAAADVRPFLPLDA